MDFNDISRAIDKYEAENYKDMSIWTEPGQKVCFMGKGGHNFQLERALELLEVGGHYTVSRIEVHGWSSDLYLEEVPGHSFNTVQFKNVGDFSEVPKDKRTSGYSPWNQ